MREQGRVGRYVSLLEETLAVVEINFFSQYFSMPGQPEVKLK